MYRMINVGFGNTINSDKIIAVMWADAAPIKRMIQSAREEGHLIDATAGRKTKSIVYMTNDVIVLSSLQPETISRRIDSNISDNYFEEVGND